MLTPGTLLGERYEVIEKIGAGGMSIVYKAKDNRLQRYVAIKELREEFVEDEQFVAKFRKEALSAASLSHPNIVGIYDVGSDKDLHYIVMEYVEGKTLKEVIAEKGPFPAKTVLELGMQMVSALKHAHSKKIIHRDIKPQNILLTNEGVLKVTDFGIAKAVDSSTIVATGNAIGSVHYFSPEQAKGKYVNESSDLYSCGIVLFELATKKLPFEADSHISIALKHINEEIPRPSQFNGSIPKNLEDLILKATSKGQLERYQNADEMLCDMKGILQNPNYEIKSSALSEHTILLSSADTQLLREQSKETGSESSSDNPDYGIYEEQTGFLSDEEDEDEDVSKMYKILVGVGGVFATLALVVVVTLAIFFWIPSLGKNANMVAVPSLQGKTYEEATQILKERKLEIKLAEGSSEEGVVIDQKPAAGKQAKKNSTVEVSLEQEGKDTPDNTVVTLPDFTGQDQREALAQIKELGLDISAVDIRPQPDEKIELGKIISQTPVGGSEVATGDPIVFYVSSGSESKVVMTRVPNIEGKSAEEAKAVLEQFNLALGSQKMEASDTVPEGIIIKQALAAGTEIEEGQSINVTVSTGPATPSPEPSVEPSPEPSVEPTTPVVMNYDYSLVLPSDIPEKDSYHVLALFNETQTVFDATVTKNQFPINISLSGTGTGNKITVLFDGEIKYTDKIDFDEVE